MSDFSSSGLQLQKSTSYKKVLLLPLIFSVDPPLPSTTIIMWHKSTHRSLQTEASDLQRSTHLVRLSHASLHIHSPGSGQAPLGTISSAALFSRSILSVLQLNLNSRSTKHPPYHTDLCDPVLHNSHHSDNDKTVPPTPKKPQLK